MEEGFCAFSLNSILRSKSSHRELLSNVKTTYVTSTTIRPHQWDENNKVV